MLLLGIPPRAAVRGDEGPGTLSPQNLPGKGKKNCRLLADGKEGLSTSREREGGAASDEVWALTVLTGDSSQH